MTLSLSICIAENGIILFSLLQYRSIVYMYHIFIHSSVNGHLSCFYVLAIVNSAAIKVGCMYHFGSCFSQGIIAFRIDWLDLPLQSKGLSRVFSSSTVEKHQFFGAQASLWSNMTAGKTIGLTRQTFAGKVMLLIFNMLSPLVIAFLPRSKHLLISWHKIMQ